MILPLGSGQAARRGCGAKAALLDRAARSKLPVPAGLIVLDEGWRFALDRRLVRIEGRGGRRPISVPDPSLLLHLVGLPAFEGPLAVRAAFSGGEGEDEGTPLHAVPGLFVDGGRSAALAAGLAGVWSAAFDRPRRFRRDVIVQAMITARHAGVAVMERGYEDDVVEVAEATSDGPGATERPLSRLLPRRRFGERPTEADPVFARLQALLRDLRRVFGAGDWVVEWADDGDRVWIIELRRATEPTRRNEAFTVASHRDILPDPPSRFMTSLVASCARGIFRRYRRLDPALPGNRPLVEVLHGRPLLNLSLLTEMLRRWGLPTRLVTDSIGGAADRDFGLQPGRLLLHARVLGRVAWSQVTSVTSARRVEQEILERTATPPVRLTEAVEELRWLYSVLAAEMLSLTFALSAPMALLRRAGVLAEWACRWPSPARPMVQGLEGLRTHVAHHPGLREALEGGVLPDDPGLRTGVESWLERFGYHGVYENDIARPRYREAPELLLRGLTVPPEGPPVRSRLSLGARLLGPIAWQGDRVLQARESLRSVAMLGFERLRRVLLARGRVFAEDGVLPSVDDLFHLDVGEVRRLEEGFRPDGAFWEARQAEMEAARAWSGPDVVHRFDDLATPPPLPAGGAPGRLVGIGLTRGRVEGRAWVLPEPSARLPEGFRPSETILVARAVDLGWLPVFALVAGVAVEIGGDLSYGSVVLREVGLPAVTNLRGLTRAVRSGERLVLNADEGVVDARQEDVR